MAVLIMYNGEEQELQTLCPINITQELSTELDSGTASFIQSGMKLNKPFSAYAVQSVHNDGSGAEFLAIFHFVGIDKAALLRSKVGNNKALSKHTVELVEPSKLLEGILIDGFGVTQPEDLSTGTTLDSVVRRLLSVANLDRDVFHLTTDEEVLNALSRVSPEFKWNPQTTLWECLEQAGAVIDAIPRLIDTNTFGFNYTTVTFDFINESNRVVAEMLDAYALPHGESISANQYNSSLGAVVENLLEE